MPGRGIKILNTTQHSQKEDKQKITEILASPSCPQLKSQGSSQVQLWTPPVLTSTWRQLSQAVSPKKFEEGTRGFRLSKLSCCNSHFYSGKKQIKNSQLLGLPWWSWWLGSHLPMPGTWVQSLVWEDAMCCMELSPCAATTESSLPRACALQGDATAMRLSSAMETQCNQK